MKQMNIEFEIPLQIGKHKDLGVISAQANKVEDEYKATITVKAKRFNRKQILKGSFYLKNDIDALQQFREYIDTNQVVKKMISTLESKLLKDFPINFPDFKLDI